ncbi:zinc finger and BTB domain-containing protein 49-like [Homarus americanus]|uniref:Longitudinals lacking protein-like 25 n=1 Tax=Homarus americanus TaxID=6706 RepID=A0A8J5JDD8_HOMAM|nr:zinc finger and BTB domain-containing protein 49-like [Homarus americanus]XP_042207036.1 zinc finger and BTB domain-containing protein 49-like [Homarus americanus]XP_042207037.1 zinc finger and BTB domain-containing protein 49-like [Homarus americanus]KAG7154646.1 Longitudinals lacking protein-like 25 [Homarus americanus]
MNDECLSLTWNNHGATYRQTLSILREENTLTDVTLACDGQKFAAHKLVLVTCSDYFRTILGDIPCQHPIVYMRGVAAREMQALIDFMYTGQTDIPQKEVPTLLATAEALQIKGLGVFTASEDSDSAKINPSRRERSSGPKKRRFESSVVLNGSNEEVSRSSSSRSTSSKDDNFLENLYSHHYALMSSPKRRKTDDKMAPKTSEYVGKSHTPTYFEKPAPKETSSSLTTKDSCQNNSSLSHNVLGDFLHHRQPGTSTPLSSTSPIPTYTSSSPPPQTLPEQLCKDPLTSHSTETAKQRMSERRPTRSPSSQQPLHDPRPEAKTASPRALNYSLAGLGASKEEFGAGSLGHMFDESNSGLAETPEKLMKAEIKEEALDFSSTTLSENLHGDSVSSTLSANNIEEETRMYLDAFARSANLSRQPTTEETLETSSADGRPFVCPICQKCFAKAAILKRHHLAHFRPYVCHLCTRSFTRREVLAEHLLEHNGADLRMPCPVCSMTIKRKRNLQAHIKVKHPEYYREKTANRQAMC